ncbi:Pestheic acid cluster transcriptional regulator [Paramyrothecium foliicola]|nr:Pestheic acid cluster transcriptional regulator [Paramyrothecium foliicola]
MFRHLISGKVRSNNGCYTCRLRRKKCDEARPVCAGCQMLEITCYSGDEKPEWMDGGPKQKEMAEKIKAQVKKQASQRRDRKYLEMLETGAKMVTLDDSPQTVSSEGRDGSVPTAFDVERLGGRDHRLTPPPSNASGNSPPEIPWHNQAFFRQATEQERGPDIDLHFIMIYLDYVFPYLFPHYRPPILVGGRGWILDVVQSNRAVYHTVVSLASYFFGIILSKGEDENGACMNRMVENLETQMELGLRELRKEMQAITTQTSQVDMREGLVVMQSIVQMLIFEVTSSNKETWKLHLDAALALFLQILPRPEHWTEALISLYSEAFPPPTMTDGFRRPFSTGQASLRFFTALLFQIDVMSSLTLGSAPRLFRFQASIIPGCQKHDHANSFRSAGPLAMEEFIGVYNWVLQMIGDVAALHSWKQVQIRAGTLPVHELLSRGQILEDAIRAGRQALEVQLKIFEEQGLAYQPSHIVTDVLGELKGQAVADTPAYVNQNWVWAQAALIHVRLVMYGWHPCDPVIRETVTAILDCMCALPNSSCLRNVIWPFCLVGCLATPEEEDKFRLLASDLGPLRVFGTCKDAIEIMEAMWARRDEIDETWDVSKCLNILGHGVLLI